MVPRIVNGPHIVFMVIKCAESSLSENLLIAMLHPDIVITALVTFIGLVAPNTDRSIVGT